MTETEPTERAELLDRLRKHLGGNVHDFETSSLTSLRQIVDGCDAQKKFYEDCGFVDMHGQKP